MKYPRVTLKAARVNADLSQKDAAKLLGVSVATLQNYESGETVPDWNLVRLIERIYRFPADYIFFGKESALSENTATPP